MELARNSLRRFGDKRAQMGLDNKTPIINRLRLADCGLETNSNIRWKDMTEANAIMGRETTLVTGESIGYWIGNRSAKCARSSGPSDGLLWMWLGGHDAEHFDYIYVN